VVGVAESELMFSISIIKELLLRKRESERRQATLPPSGFIKPEPKIRYRRIMNLWLHELNMPVTSISELINFGHNNEHSLILTRARGGVKEFHPLIGVRLTGGSINSMGKQIGAAGSEPPN